MSLNILFFLDYPLIGLLEILLVLDNVKLLCQSEYAHYGPQPTVPIYTVVYCLALYMRDNIFMSATIHHKYRDHTPHPMV